MVNVTIHTDFAKTQEITGQDMVIVTTVNRNGEIGLAMAGGKGVNSKVMLAALVRTTAGITIRTLEGKPKKNKKIPGGSGTIVIGNCWGILKWLKEKSYGKRKI